PAVSQSVQRAVAMRDGKTSTELRGVVRFDRPIGGDQHAGYEEYLLVDSSGRVQIPREYLDELNIGRLVKADVGGDRVRIWRASPDSIGEDGHQGDGK
ncbi:MAG: AbrB/MazE/SpoVT family DNA-binding domain-containing protein, partial [Chloroflexota bacterium]